MLHALIALDSAVRAAPTAIAHGGQTELALTTVGVILTLAHVHPAAVIAAAGAHPAAVIAAAFGADAAAVALLAFGAVVACLAAVRSTFVGTVGPFDADFTQLAGRRWATAVVPTGHRHPAGGRRSAHLVHAACRCAASPITAAGTAGDIAVAAHESLAIGGAGLSARVAVGTHTGLSRLRLTLLAPGDGVFLITGHRQGKQAQERHPSAQGLELITHEYPPRLRIYCRSDRLIRADVPR